MDIYSQDDYYRQKIITVFLYMIKIFGCLVNKLPPKVPNDVKQVLKILHYLGIFSFEVSINVPKFCQYFIVGMSLIEIITNISTDFDIERMRIYCKNWRPFSPE